MSKNIKKTVMDSINQKHLHIRPKWHFVLGATLSSVGLIITMSMSLLAIHLLKFRLTHPGIGAARKLDFILTNLPWYIPVLGVLGLVGGYYLLKRYDFSYRKNFGYIVLAIIISLLLGSYALSSLRLDDFLTKRGYFRQIYQDQSNDYAPTGRGEGRMQNRYGRN